MESRIATRLQRIAVANIIARESKISALSAQQRLFAHQAVICHKLSKRFYASSSSSSSSSDPPPKHTILEEPDSFRPPSHGSRLKSRSRSTTASYGSYGSGNYSYAGGYNQGTSDKEKDQQKHKKYPNMFPNEGTFMHWFLTTRAVHLWISLGTLSLLSVFTLTSTFVKTSPFAHLLPPLSSLIWHPVTFVRESASAVRLHIDYTSEQTAEKRRQNILDAQKRRLYRRAHGMEDLSKDEAEGIDVTGLVPWDDGLSEPERRRKAEQAAKARKERGEINVDVLVHDAADAGSRPEQQPQRKKVKRWLGIWE